MRDHRAAAAGRFRASTDSQGSPIAQQGRFCILPLMTAESRRSSTPMLWLPFALVLLALGLRWLKLESPGMTLLPNFSPWMALAFTGTLIFPRTIAWWVWPLLLAGIDFASQGTAMWTLADGRWEVFLTYGCYAAAAFGAQQLRGRVGVVTALLGVAGCGVAFYLITNTLCWAAKPYYAKDFTGWVQALTTGIPGFPPTWVFLRNSLLSDLGFSAVLWLAFNAEARVRNLTLTPLVRRSEFAGSV